MPRIIRPADRGYNLPAANFFLESTALVQNHHEMASSYRGRFAPSPTGPLHRGSLVAALASWLDARANQGKWLIRLEDIDTPRERPGAAAEQIASLARLGMESDEPILYQSTRGTAYALALQELWAKCRVFHCDCSRSRRAAEDPQGTVAPYPGTCRDRGLDAPAAVRFRVEPGIETVLDRAQGVLEQDVAAAVGDFIVRRSDGLWAYQLAVVVDDAYQGITHIVRGADLLDNTPRQRQLQRALGLPHPVTLHVPLVRDASGRKLSKQEGDAPLAALEPLEALEQAWQHLGFAPSAAGSLREFQEIAITRWAQRWRLDEA